MYFFTTVNRSVFRFWGRLLSLFSLLICFILISSTANAMKDPLQDSSPHSDRASKGLILDITRAGQRLIVLGERGHILLSDDEGKHWQQANVPVRVTLTALTFDSADQGWAVGHSGVILHTVDGGESWHVQLDGYQANQLIENRLRALVELSPEERLARGVLYSEDELRYLLNDAELFSNEGPSRPFLDVTFLDSQNGFAVGAYGMIFQTSDGGSNWQPWFDHLPNPDNYHLNAISRDGGLLFIGGEAGSLFLSADSGKNWNQIESPYDGAFFGVSASHRPAGSETLVAYGLRGHAFISQDQGSSWQSLETGSDATIFGSVKTDSFEFTLLNANGEMLRYNHTGQFLGRSLAPQRSALSSGLELQNSLLLVGPHGITPLSNSQIEWVAP